MSYTGCWNTENNTLSNTENNTLSNTENNTLSNTENNTLSNTVCCNTQWNTECALYDVRGAGRGALLICVWHEMSTLQLQA